MRPLVIDNPGGPAAAKAPSAEVAPTLLLALVRDLGRVEVTYADRVEFGRALILQGYSSARAAEMANDLEDNDGALQMLARHRLDAMLQPLAQGLCEAAEARFRKMVQRIAEWTDEEVAIVSPAQVRHVAQVVLAGADPTYPPFAVSTRKHEVSDDQDHPVPKDVPV
ncbi:hypothetical protein [Sphingomonas sp. ACRSK]|uniref:hypothetical protein n=1 Tax=Sphingomonas sp. ACRSK TaxID=2918213 RepID=UPI001EF4F278|nr:hypothetical protein [Sphingomonas sp. ACRSK]MCG7349233.1 hypothetical protein [Sphingomonas sp. ACRSK]